MAAWRPLKRIKYTPLAAPWRPIGVPHAVKAAVRSR
jgi:hypothetical protein